MRINRITIFLPNLEGGGAERVMVTLANEFVAKGIEVNLLLVKATGPYLREVDIKVNVIALGASKNVYSLFPLIKYLWKNKPEVILSTLLMTNLVVVLAKKMARVNTRVVIREAITASSDNKYNKMTIDRIISVFRSWALKNADAIIAPSHGVAKDLITYCRVKSQKIKVIYNPVDLKTWLELSRERNEIINSIPTNVKIILAIGRLTKQKDFVTLIRSFIKVKAKINAVLIILGEGNERAKLESLINENGLNDCVILPGFTVNPFPFLKRANVFVLSSLYEGMPNSLIQAVAFKKQIVSTNCPSGPFEILKAGYYGYLVEVGDTDNMALGIERGLNAQLNVQSTESIIEMFDSGTISKKYLDVLNNEQP
jgi:glycosyltransferase involved in cell wall biosynthesis